MGKMTKMECAYQRFLVRYRIRETLESKDLSLTDIARQIGLSRASVSATVRGLNNSPRILGALREAGVPETLLFDPRKQEQ